MEDMRTTYRTVVRKPQNSALRTCRSKGNTKQDLKRE